MINFIQINSLSFDLENPFGYSIAVIIESVLFLRCVHYVACFLSIALTAFLFVASMNVFIKDGLQSINKMAKDKKSESDIVEPLSRMIRTNAEVKQLSFFIKDCRMKSI